MRSGCPEMGVWAAHRGRFRKRERALCPCLAGSGWYVMFRALAFFFRYLFNLLTFIRVFCVFCCCCCFLLLMNCCYYYYYIVLIDLDVFSFVFVIHVFSLFYLISLLFFFSFIQTVALTFFPFPFFVLSFFNSSCFGS